MMDFINSPYLYKDLPLFLVGIGSGYLLGMLAFGLKRTKTTTENDTDDNIDIPVYENPSYAVALVVNSSLKMGKGKVAAQCGHAILSLCKKSLKNSRDLLKAWNEQGQEIKIVSVKSEEDFEDLQQIAEMESLDYYVVADAGRTQIKSGSLTVMGIGPGRIDTINNIVNNLPVYT